MLLYEHEAKGFLRRQGLAVPRGRLAASPAEALAALAEVPLPAMIKAQVLGGGRGKAGGILQAASRAEAEAQAAGLLGVRLGRHLVESLLIEERIAVERELYIAVMLDGAEIQLLLGKAGGIDVETVEFDAGFARLAVDPLYGLGAYRIREALEDLAIEAGLWHPLAAVAAHLIELTRTLDATLVEINPLGVTPEGKLVALDARIRIDEGALFRQPELRAIRHGRPPKPGILGRLEELQIQFVPTGGPVGLIGSGAGNGVTILDWLDTEDSKAFGFMDLDYAVLGGQTEEALRTALGFLAEAPEVRAILVNFTACGYRVDLIAETLVRLLAETGAEIEAPLFLHFQGNRGEAAQAILRRAGHQPCATLGDAVRGAAAAAREAEKARMEASS